MKTLLSAYIVSCVTVLTADLVNIDFDSPNLSGSLTPVYPGQSIAPFFGRTSDLLRGWSLTLDGNVVETTIYSPWDSISATRDGMVTLQQRNPVGSPSFGGDNYLIFDPSIGEVFRQFRISQTGSIPINAAGLNVYSTLRWSMLVNDSPVGDWFQAQTGPLDVSQFAGQAVKIEFVFQGQPEGVFDILGFSQVPEPSTYALFGIGMALMGFVYLRRRPSC